jgi:hypothetical protein
MDGGRVVIACYRPKAGREADLGALVRRHCATLRSIGLVTDRASITMQSGDGTYIEVFEWASREAIEAAHGHPVVRKMWEAFGEVCDYLPVSQVPEASQLFSEFAPVAVESSAA